MPKLAANLTMLFNEVEFLDRFALAADAGFKGVEFLFPYDYPALELRGRLQANRLEQILFNMPAGNWNAGERGLACLPARVSDFRDSVDQTIEYVKALKCRKVHCMAGIPNPDDHPDEVRSTYIDNLRYAADRLRAYDVTVMVEPINDRDMAGYYLNYIQDALDIIAETGVDNVALQFDIYHVQIMEDRLFSALSTHIDDITHIQMADVPGRHEPGTGEIDFPALFQHLDQLGYSGWIGCEYNPRSTTQKSLNWAADYLEGEH